MMKIEKLSDSTYRIRKVYKGKRYTVMFDHKPSQKEALEAMTEKLNVLEIGHTSLTLYKAYLDYLESKSNILSPSTKRGYKTVINAIPDSIKSMNICDIDNSTIQKFVNDYSISHSPKTTKNVYSLISTLISEYAPNTKLKIRLPQAIKKEPYIPTAEEVKSIMQELKGTKYYVPISLAALGLRRSEICALSIDDLSDDNILTISKALVSDDSNNFVLKTTKTTESTRTIFIPDDIASIIRDQGFVYRGHPEMIYRNLQSIQKKLGIQQFPLHKLRHFFASYAHNELKLSDAQIMELGGWKSTNVLTSVYRHAMEQEKAKKDVAESMKKLF